MIDNSNISMRKVSRLSGMPITNLSWYLAGKKDAQCDTISRVMLVLGLSIQVKPNPQGYRTTIICKNREGKMVRLVDNTEILGISDGDDCIYYNDPDDDKMDADYPWDRSELNRYLRDQARKESG